MPLPTLSTVAQKTAGGLKTIRERLGTSKPESPKEASAQSNTPVISRNTPSSNTSSNLISRVATPVRNRSAAQAVDTSSFSRNQEANEKALERSRVQTNPLVPLIQTVNQTLIRNR